VEEFLSGWLLGGAWTTKKVRSPKRMPGNVKLEAAESGSDAMLNSFNTMLNILLNILWSGRRERERRKRAEAYMTTLY
jgi:hypothetical protein